MCVCFGFRVGISWACGALRVALRGGFIVGSSGLKIVRFGLV